MENSRFKIPKRFLGQIFGLLTILLIMSVVTASAQNKKMKKTPQERTDNAITYWNKHLNLTADQQGKFKTLLTEEFAKRDSIQSAVKDRKSRYDALNQLKDETHTKMETVLTPEQHEIFVKMRSVKKGKSWNMKKSSKSD